MVALPLRSERASTTQSSRWSSGVRSGSSCLTTIPCSVSGKSDRMKLFHEMGKVPKRFQIRWCRTVWIEVHDVVSDCSDLFQLLNEHASIDRQSKLCPSFGILKQANVCSEIEVGDPGDLAPAVSRILSFGQLLGVELPVDEAPNVVLNLTQQEKWLAQL